MCRQLGFSDVGRYCNKYIITFNKGSLAVTGTAFGNGAASTILDSFGCVGIESRILDCPHSNSRCNSRSSSSNAGVRCHTQTSNTLHSTNIVYVNMYVCRL